MLTPQGPRILCECFILFKFALPSEPLGYRTVLAMNIAQLIVFQLTVRLFYLFGVLPLTPSLGTSLPHLVHLHVRVICNVSFD